ncbi:DUF998 domain-containing protein [Agrococcus sp. ProA11]|uniref:DUF998 domain-containing protein n=1 Tax=Agrococcus chionoecetis TaxID=3153752 RepID=UPI00326022A1
MHLRARRIAGGVLLVATAQYFVAEVVTAAAWVRAPYSFVRHYVSDLGIPECLTSVDPVICSPAHAVMNTGFVLQGVLVASATWLLMGELRRGWRWPVGILGHVFAVGVIMVGLLPGSVDAGVGSESARNALHVIGATLAIGGGMLLVGAVAGALLHAGQRRLSAAIGALALLDGIGVVLFTIGHEATIGATERLAVWPTTLAFVTLGVAALHGARRAYRSPSSPSGS